MKQAIHTRPQATNEIEFVLTAMVDGQVVYRGKFADTAILQEDGLRKSESAVEREIEGGIYEQ